MDISLPDTSGIEATRAIKRLMHSPHVAMLSMHDNAEYRTHAREAGAIGYIVKSAMESTLPLLLETLSNLRRHILPRVVETVESNVASEALEISEEQLRLALEAGDMGIFNWDLATGVVTWSAEHARLFGKNLDQFDGTYASFSHCVYPDDLPGIEQAIQEARDQHSTYQCKHRIVWPDGSLRWIHGKGRFYYNANGQAQRMTGVVQDITEIMQTLLELEDKQLRLSTILDHNPQCIKLLDRHGVVREMNRAGADMLGLSDVDNVIGQTVDGFIAPEYLEQVRDFYASVIDGHPGQFEFEILRVDGTRRLVESHAVPLACPGTNEMRVLSVTIDITQRKTAEDQLRFLSHHDTLTDLPNRLLFTDRLQQAMIEGKRHQRPIGVIMLGIDRFKTVNDSLGHDVGDALLLATAQRLSEAVRPSDTVARFGGDEFAILLSDMDKSGDATLVVQRIMNTFNKPFVLSGHELFMSASLGATLHPADDPSANVGTLLRNADTALYRAKKSGLRLVSFIALK